MDTTSAHILTFSEIVSQYQLYTMRVSIANRLDIMCGEGERNYLTLFEGR